MENLDKLIHYFSTKAIYFNTYIPPAMYVSTNLCLKIVLYSKLPLFDLINDKNPLRCFKLVQRSNILGTF